MAPPTNTQFAVAVHVLAYLSGAGGGRLVSSDELAGSVNVNPVHIRRVLGPLREAGLVGSRPGVHGGWELRRPAASIDLAEVWQVVQAGNPVLGLHGPSPDCPVGRGIQRALVDLDHTVAAAVAAELSRTSVADVVLEALPDGLPISAS